MTACSVGAQYRIILGGENYGQSDQRVDTTCTLQKFMQRTVLLKAERPVLMVIGSLQYFYKEKLEEVGAICYVRSNR
jgi:hypothetical protein